MISEASDNKSMNILNCHWIFGFLRLQIKLFTYTVVGCVLMHSYKYKAALNKMSTKPEVINLRNEKYGSRGRTLDFGTIPTL